MHLSFVVVPVEGNAEVSGAIVFDRDFIVALEDICEVCFVFFTCVFYTKVVHAQRELDGPCFVEP